MRSIWIAAALAAAMSTVARREIVCFVPGKEGGSVKRLIVPHVALLVTTPAHVDTIGNWGLKPHDPLEQPPKQWPDGPLKKFFQGLLRPDNISTAVRRE